MKRWLKLAEAALPTEGRFGRWVGFWRSHPALWAMNRRKVALGAGLGLAVGVIPLPTQMILAAGLAFLFRANVPAAVLATWLTNPFTMLPIWSLAWYLGDAVTYQRGFTHLSGAFDAVNWMSISSIWDFFSSSGAPLLIGLPLAGLTLGLALWIVIMIGWRLTIGFIWAQRKRKHKTT